MNPRPRNKANAGLPPNLYARNNGTTYAYRRPDDGTWHGMGADRHAAIQAAKQLNSLLMAGDALVSSVIGGGQTLREFIDHYEQSILIPRDLAPATLSQFRVRKRQIIAQIGDKALDAITTMDVSALLDAMPPRSSNQTRQHLVDIFAHAAAKGFIADNPAALTIRKLEKRARKRHTVAGLRLIREAAPLWLRNAIDLALLTAQRREDILAARFDNYTEANGLYLAQMKTEKYSDAGYINFKPTPQLKAIITRCRDNIPSPFLIHRRPDRLDAKQRQQKEHWTAITPTYLSHAFKSARDAANPYPALTPEEQPGFHEIRALSLHLYKKAGKKIEQRKQIAGHTSEKMTRNYEADHEDIVWTAAEADLDIDVILK